MNQKRTKRPFFVVSVVKSCTFFNEPGVVRELSTINEQNVVEQLKQQTKPKTR